MIFTINFVDAEKIVKNEPIFEKRLYLLLAGIEPGPFR